MGRRLTLAQKAEREKQEERILKLMARESISSARGLGALMCVEGTKVTPMLKRLEARGLVERAGLDSAGLNLWRLVA